MTQKPIRKSLLIQNGKLTEMWLNLVLWCWLL